MNDNLNHSSTSLSSHDVESTLVAYDAYIVSLMRNGTFTYLPFMDRDDLTQQVRIKMMRALAAKRIHHISTYLRSIAHNEYVSFMRRQKPMLPLLESDEEDVQGYREDELASMQEGCRDPQVEIEAMNSYYERIEILVCEVVTLPKVQMRVAVCYIRDRIDDPLLLADAFKRHNLDISTLQWPIDPKEKQRLQASYTPVRKKLAQAMGIDLVEYKGRAPISDPYTYQVH